MKDKEPICIPRGLVAIAYWLFLDALLNVAQTFFSPTHLAGIQFIVVGFSCVLYAWVAAEVAGRWYISGKDKKQ